MFVTTVPAVPKRAPARAVVHAALHVALRGGHAPVGQLITLTPPHTDPSTAAHAPASVVVHVALDVALRGGHALVGLLAALPHECPLISNSNPKPLNNPYTRTPYDIDDPSTAAHQRVW